MHPEILISRFTWKESGQEDDDVLTHQHRFLQHLHFLLRSHLRLDPAELAMSERLPAQRDTALGCMAKASPG